ncbi:MAG: hypothetical protein RIF34_01550, partial [Candidatus Kapaibacterium sp.]
ITVAENELMNMFPTDLHGGIDKDHYISSLRIGGEACEQIERIGRIIVSDIDSVFYQSAYDLGKNHMQSMKPLTKFDLSNEYSEVFKFPLPTGVGSYKELEVMETFDIGIHRLFIYNVLRERTVKPISPLFHIHSYYAQWRKNNKLPTDYLFRNGNA